MHRYDPASRSPNADIHSAGRSLAVGEKDATYQLQWEQALRKLETETELIRQITNELQAFKVWLLALRTQPHAEWCTCAQEPPGSNRPPKTPMLRSSAAAAAASAGDDDGVDKDVWPPPTAEAPQRAPVSRTPRCGLVAVAAAACSAPSGAAVFAALVLTRFALPGPCFFPGLPLLRLNNAFCLLPQQARARALWWRRWRVGSSRQGPLCGPCD